MSYPTKPTIQDIIDQAKYYFDQGISQSEAIRLAISASKPAHYTRMHSSPTQSYIARPN
ncbi:hypothetical protein [Spirosoma gilvum]